MKKAQPKSLPKKLPQFLKPYFWEIDSKSLNPRKSTKYVVERLMDWGDIKVFKWLTDNFSAAYLKKIARDSRQLFNKNKIFWLNYLKVYPKEVLCSQEELLQKPNIAWPY